MDTRQRVLIADDEPLLAADLATRLARLDPALDICAVVHNGPAALEALYRLKPDIAFLDIRMPALSGLDVARHAQETAIVFVTAYEQYAIEAFEQAAVDYLLKPASDDRLQQTLQRLRQRRSALPAGLLPLLERLNPTSTAPEPLRWIRASRGESVHLVDVQDVAYFHADDKYTVVMADQEYLIRTPLKELLEQLDGQQFWQIHRSTLVNVKAIHSVQRELTGRCRLKLKNRDEELTVSRAYAHLFRQM